MTKKISFEQSITSKAGNKKVKIFRDFVNNNGMNYMKFLCLNWQHTTNKKCMNKKHLAGQYGRGLECEAQLTESIVMQVKFSGMSDESFKAMMSDFQSKVNDHE